MIPLMMLIPTIMGIKEYLNEGKNLRVWFIGLWAGFWTVLGAFASTITFLKMIGVIEIGNK